MIYAINILVIYVREQPHYLCDHTGSKQQYIIQVNVGMNGDGPGTIYRLLDVFLNEVIREVQKLSSNNNPAGPKTLVMEM